ncbi:MAG: hypothetical protein COA62_15865 [Rhodobiaceae bacterium]|nr:MAG: hypothetical protein COA62_15865 [Rhodobiaceae bacterium]
MNKLDFNHRPEFGPALADMVDRAIIDGKRKEPVRKYLGGSLIGRECDREIQFMFFHTPPDPGKDFPPHILRTFELGHEFEKILFKYLRQCGFEILTHHGDGRQIGFTQLNARFKGHCDGIVISGPEKVGRKSMRYPQLLEIKTANDSNYKKYEYRGVQKAKPVYYAQMALYLAYMDEHFPGISDGGALFAAVNKNTSELYFEHVPFDVQNAQEMSDRAVHILAACDGGDLLPRVAAKPDDFRCTFCSYSDRCWSFDY